MRSDIALKGLIEALKNTFEGTKKTSIAVISAIDPAQNQRVTGATGTINNVDGLSIKTKGLTVNVGDVIEVARPKGQPANAPWEATGEIIYSTRPFAGTSNAAATITAPAITGTASAAYSPATGGYKANIAVTFTPTVDMFGVTHYVLAYVTDAEHTAHSADATWVWPNVKVDHVTGQTALTGTATDLLVNTGYKVRLKAVTPFNESAWTATTNVTTANATIGSGGSDISLQSWNNNAVWTVTDLDTISWNAHTITFANGTAYSIGAGNTGNMAALTYIYLDIAVSTTAYQTTTTWSTAVGDGKVIVNIAKNGAAKASHNPQNGLPAIGAELVVTTSLAALSATMGDLTINGTLTGTGYNIASDSFNFTPSGADTSYLLFKNGATTEFVIRYNKGSDLFITNESNINPSLIHIKNDSTNGSVVLTGGLFIEFNAAAATQATIRAGGIYPGSQTTRYFSDDGTNLVANGRFNIVGDMGLRATAKLIGYGATTTVLTIAGNGAAEGIGAIELSGNPTDADGAVLADINGWAANNTATYQRIAWIRFALEGTTANKRGGRIEFWTEPDNSATPVKCWYMDKDGTFIPVGAGSFNIGDASNYPNVINHKVLTDRGCLVDVDPVQAMAILRGVGVDLTRKPQKKHTDNNLKMLKYKNFPNWVYDDGKIKESDGSVVQGEEGLDINGVLSIHEGAHKFHDSRMDAIEARLNAGGL